MITARITFYGACRDAIEFYKEVFHAKVVKQTLFKDNADMFPMGLSEDMEDLVYYALLQVTDEQGTSYICVEDTPALVFTGKADYQGCQFNSIFDVEVGSDAEVERIYDAFVGDGAKCNVPLCEKGNYSKYASFIDRFGVCWNVYCEK